MQSFVQWTGLSVLTETTVAPCRSMRLEDCFPFGMAWSKLLWSQCQRERYLDQIGQWVFQLLEFVRTFITNPTFHSHKYRKSKYKLVQNIRHTSDSNHWNGAISSKVTMLICTRNHIWHFKLSLSLDKHKKHNCIKVPIVVTQILWVPCFY